MRYGKKQATNFSSYKKDDMHNSCILYYTSGRIGLQQRMLDGNILTKMLYVINSIMMLFT